MAACTQATTARVRFSTYLVTESSNKGRMEQIQGNIDQCLNNSPVRIMSRQLCRWNQSL